jgi:hypothetical protein
MSSYCAQCALDELGEDRGDFRGLQTGALAMVLCAGCGITSVDGDGRCVAYDCAAHHGLEDLERWPASAGVWFGHPVEDISSGRLAEIVRLLHQQSNQAARDTTDQEFAWVEVVGTELRRRFERTKQLDIYVGSPAWDAILLWIFDPDNSVSERVREHARLLNQQRRR